MDPVKQLSIKTGSVRRLGGDYRSYGSEYATYCRQLEAATQSGDAHAIKRAREFVDECHATRVDIRLRLLEACSALESYLATHTELAGSAEWARAQQTLQDNTPQTDHAAAAATLGPQQQTQQRHSTSQQATSGSSSGGVGVSGSGRGSGGGSAVTSSLSAPSVAPFRIVPFPPPSLFSVAVYGGSQAKPGDAAYERAKQLGQQLALHHFHIVPTPHTSSRHGLSDGTV